MYIVLFWDIAHHSAEPILQRCAHGDELMNEYVSQNSDIWFLSLRECFQMKFIYGCFFQCSCSFFFIIFHNFSFHFSHICNRNMHEGIILLSVSNMIWKSIIYFCHFFRNIRCKLQFNYILIKGFCSNSSSKSIQKLYDVKEKKNILF